MLENYQALLKDAMADGASNFNEEAGTITYKGPEMEKPIILKVELPLGDVSDEVIFVLKKRELGH